MLENETSLIGASYPLVCGNGNGNGIVKPKQFDSSATPSGLQTIPLEVVKSALGTQRLPPEHCVIQTLLEKELLRLN